MRPLLATIVALAAATSASASALPGDPRSSAHAAATPAPAAASEPAAAGQAAAVPSQAVIEKLGQGDRLFLAGDRRSALFTYLDAVYMQPAYAPARVKLGRAYLALRHPALAVAQAEAALAADPESAEAALLLADATQGGERSADATRSAPASASARRGAPAIPDPPPPSGTRRVFRLEPQPGARGDAPAGRGESGAPAPSVADRPPEVAPAASR